MPRCLIHWDDEATGIWLFPSNADACRPPLGSLLSPALRQDLKRWNDWGARLFNGRVLEPDDVQVTRRKAMQLDLPRQARDELGGAWEALYQDAGAWTWVRSRQP